MSRRFLVIASLLALLFVGSVSSDQETALYLQETATLTQQPLSSYLAFAIDPNQVYLMRPDGSELRHLTSIEGKVEIINLDWSPDGAKIVIAVFGSEGQILTISRTGAKQMVTAGLGFYYTVQWASNGEKIAFSVKPNDSDVEHIYIVNPDGTNLIRLTGSRDVSGDPQWSPEGKRIAYISAPNLDAPTQIHVMNADGTNAVSLTKSKFSAYSPAWSPDGKRIAFVSSQGKKSQIYIMQDDGTNQMALSDGKFSGGSPKWSPNGKYIAFRQSESQDSLQVYVVKADGSHLVHIEFRPDGPEDTAFTYETESFAWAPDSQQIAVTFLNLAKGRHDIYLADVGCIEAQPPCSAVPLRNLTSGYDLFRAGSAFALEWSPAVTN